MTMLSRAIWCAAVLLVLLGTAAAIGRGVFVADFTTGADPAREWMLRAFHRSDPFLAQRPAELERFDRRFAEHPRIARVHVVAGAVFLTLALVQFSSRVRSRYIELHRWSGRILLLAAFAIGASAFYFGLLIPFAGVTESAAIALFGGLFLTAVSLAFVAIRKRQVERHREWMIRAFAIAIGISTVRVVGAVLDVTLTPSGVPPDQVFVISIWTGWAMTVAAGEGWIRYTRR
jgi:uncharacterized membrane protein